MKKVTFTILALLIVFVAVLAGCSGGKKEKPSSPPVDETGQPEQPPQDTEEPPPVTPETVPDGDIVDGALATKKNPVPFGVWALITISDGGWPKPAFARVIDVATDYDETQAAIDAYNAKNADKIVPPLEEHAELLEYVVVTFETYFPAGFTDSDSITFGGLVVHRENNKEDWIASDSSYYYWLGTVVNIEAPSKEDGYPKNGDTVQFKTCYPMIKGYTGYTLEYKERTVDLSETISTFFAIE